MPGVIVARDPMRCGDANLALSRLLGQRAEFHSTTTPASKLVEPDFVGPYFWLWQLSSRKGGPLARCR